jgi:hypothetical protein
MNEYFVILIFVLWYVLALVISENLGKKKKLGVEWSFFLSIMFSPVVGYVITRFSPNIKN